MLEKCPCIKALRRLLNGSNTTDNEERQRNVVSDDCSSGSDFSSINENPLFGGIMRELLLFIAIVVSVSYFFIAHDLFDWWYEYTRAHESWELDELSCVILVMLLAYFILVQRRFFIASKMHRKFRELSLELLEKERQECKQKRMAVLANMAVGIAHDINNAIQPALGLGDFVIDGLKESRNDKHLAYMNTIMNGIQHAHGILDNVMQFSHGKMLCLEEFWARAILLHTLNFCSSVLPAGNSCVWSGLDTLDTEDERLVLYCNETSLRQILFNLMKNASDAMGGKGRIEVVVARAKLKDGQGNDMPAVSVRVSDTGCGMDKETMDRIFEPFFTTKDLSEGTGFGLASVLSLMQAHNGEISVESVPGEGSVFTLCFPVVINPSEDFRGERDDLCADITE